MSTKGKNEGKEKWALILGGSKGLGLATAKKLAMEGFQLFIVHRDRRTNLAEIEKQFEFLRAQGAKCLTFNSDALNSEKRREVIRAMAGAMGSNSHLRLVVHSIAKGHLKSMLGENRLTTEDVNLTVNAMAGSLYAWCSELMQEGLLIKGSGVLSFTSEGSSRVLPSYAAVGIAKSALEALSRHMAVEWAHLGIRVNCIQAGVTMTDSLQRIPNSGKILAHAKKRNPSGRITSPEDVANAAYLFTLEEASWITGTVLKVDGGESLC